MVFQFTPSTSARPIDLHRSKKKENVHFITGMKKKSHDRMKRLDELNRHYQTHKDLIRTRLSEFSSVPPEEYFYELAYCLLTPQSSAAHAEQTIALLRAAGFLTQSLNPEPILRQKGNYIRFHRTKSKYLVLMKNQFPVIAEKLAEPLTASDLREWLVTQVIGLGYKEATHFLRNIGKNHRLAILDRHILRSLKDLGVIPSIPKSMNKRQYHQIEQRFLVFADNIGIVLDELDLVLWSMETGEVRK